MIDYRSIGISSDRAVKKIKFIIQQNGFEEFDIISYHEVIIILHPDQLERRQQ